MNFALLISVLPVYFFLDPPETGSDACLEDTSDFNLRHDWFRVTLIWLLGLTGRKVHVSTMNQPLWSTRSVRFCVRVHGWLYQQLHTAVYFARVLFCFGLLVILNIILHFQVLSQVYRFPWEIRIARLALNQTINYFLPLAKRLPTFPREKNFRCCRNCEAVLRCDSIHAVRRRNGCGVEAARQRAAAAATAQNEYITIIMNTVSGRVADFFF